MASGGTTGKKQEKNGVNLFIRSNSLSRSLGSSSLPRTPTTTARYSGLAIVHRRAACDTIICLLSRSKQKPEGNFSQVSPCSRRPRCIPCPPLRLKASPCFFAWVVLHFASKYVSCGVGFSFPEIRSGMDMITYGTCQV